MAGASTAVVADADVVRVLALTHPSVVRDRSVYREVPGSIIGAGQVVTIIQGEALSENKS
jgi:hypothetical protein